MFCGYAIPRFCSLIELYLVVFVPKNQQTIHTLHHKPSPRTPDSTVVRSFRPPRFSAVQHSVCNSNATLQRERRSFLHSTIVRPNFTTNIFASGSDKRHRKTRTRPLDPSPKRPGWQHRGVRSPGFKGPPAERLQDGESMCGVRTLRLVMCVVENRHTLRRPHNTGGRYPPLSQWCRNVEI